MRWFVVPLIVPMILIAKHHECLADGSFAFPRNSTGHLTTWGSSWDEPSAERALAAALSDCEKTAGPGRCATHGIFRNRCAALATQSGFKRYSYKFAPEKKVAEDLALVACNKIEQGKRCQIATTICDRTNEDPIVCAKPVFPELRRLRDMLAQEPSKLAFVEQATLYLLNKYCTTIGRALTKSSTERVNQYCNMYADTSNVEGPLYWEECRSAE
ncbi:hypothetical protein ACVWXL_009005 [Bradyrhizobium sp. GM22.5]